MSVKGFRFKQADIGKFKTCDSDIVAEKLSNSDRVIGLTMGKFSLIDLVHSILKKTGKADVVICTWSAGIKDAHQVKWMVDTDLINNIKMVADHSYKTRQKRYALTIEEMIGVENIRTSEVHAKFVLIRNEKYNISIRTSMNLNANKTCETFEIDNDKEIYDFYNSFIEHLFDDMPNGYEQKSYIANKSLQKFFNDGEEPKPIKQQWYLD